MCKVNSLDRVDYAARIQYRTVAKYPPPSSWVQATIELF
jgi:hypothetical protein